MREEGREDHRWAARPGTRSRGCGARRNELPRASALRPQARAAGPGPGGLLGSARSASMDSLWAHVCVGDDAPEHMKPTTTLWMYTASICTSGMQLTLQHKRFGHAVNQLVNCYAWVHVRPNRPPDGAGLVPLMWGCQIFRSGNSPATDDS